MIRRHSSQGKAVVAGLTVALVLVVVLSLTACGTGVAASGTSASKTSSTLQTRELSRPARVSGTAAEEEIAKVVAADNDFSLALFQAVRKGDENLVCSPYSASTILTLAMAGARGQTQEEMKQALRITLPYYSLHGAVNALDQDLTAGGQFQTANGLWAQKGRTIKQPFVNVAGHYYGASINVYDMQDDYSGMCNVINAWVSEKTAGLIKDMMDPRDKPDIPYLLMMLVNAAHFKADWADPFYKPASPWLRPFYFLNGTQADVPMMRKESGFRCAKTDELQAIELPYEGRRYSMVILMPAEGGFEDLAASLGPAELSGMLAGFKENKVKLTMPRFETSSSPAVTEGLKALGMTTAFDLKHADFTGIADPIGDLPWFITDVKQKAYIKVNEQGTEAAAATGITVGAAGTTVTEGPPVEITIDHPFVYLIRDTQTGAIIFLGQVVDPRPAGGASRG